MAKVMTLTSVIFAVSMYSFLLRRCHSFKQVKRRFSPQSYVIGRSVGPFSNYHFTARGGDISGDNYEESDGTFSQFIDSFEEELSEIRREAEIEAEIEMQKLLGLVDRSQKVYEDEVADEIVSEPDYEEVVYNEEDESIDDEQSTDVLDSKIEETIEQNEVLGVVEDESSFDESELSGNELDTISEPVLQDEEDTYDLDEQPIQQGEREIIATDEEEETAISEDISHEVAVESNSAALVDMTASDDNEIESMPKAKAKKQQKSKSRKGRASKGKKKRKVLMHEELEDQANYDDTYGVSSVSITEKKSIESTSKGLRYYLQTDLVRAVVLFIATVAVSIWLQRLQRQMEAQGI